MTQHKNSNEEDKAQHDFEQIDNQDQTFEQSWDNFVSNHESDLQDIESSYEAKRFKKKIRQQNKKKHLKRIKPRKESLHAPTTDKNLGPRDFASSWLDVDQVMDQSSEFIPPNPQLRPPSGSTLVYGLLTLIGCLGLVFCLFTSHIPKFLATVFGFCVFIGIAGLLTNKTSHQKHLDPNDKGARV